MPGVKNDPREDRLNQLEDLGIEEKALLLDKTTNEVTVAGKFGRNRFRDFRGCNGHPRKRCVVFSTLKSPIRQNTALRTDFVLGATKIKFDVPAVLRKWPSLKGERVSASLGARPYIVFDGTLDECIRQFMSKPASQHPLYEIHTSPQAGLITAVLSAEQVIELARLRDFL